eukprot:Hpha_TRINITY_DN22465_c0_g1::TRINITY_DN22465_c0_g1_i1::g.94928::m.94928
MHQSSLRRARSRGEEAVRSRVGGGHTTRTDAHAHPYKWSESVSPRKLRPTERIEAGPHEEHAVETAGASAFVVVQGGTALWTAHRNGELHVRSTQTGEDFGDQRRGSSGTVTALTHDRSFVWAGLDDGRLEVYDMLLMMLVRVLDTGGGGGVSVLQCCHQGGVVALSRPGSEVSRWSGEIDGFHLRSHRTLRSAPESMVVSTSFVFVGDSSGKLHQLSRDDLKTAVEWETPHAPGAVTAVTLLEGMLASGGWDGGICLW